MATTDADRAYEQIKKRIVTVEMEPGSVIREASLMQELNLGRTPIREALKRLQAEDLVNMTPRRGMFVAGIAITDLTQIYEIRVELESLCVYLAAERITTEQLDEMRQLLDQYQSLDKGDLQALFSLDHCLHSLLAQASGNKFLQNEIERFYNLSLRIWHVAIQNVTCEDVDVGAHLDILSAIEAHDPMLARQRMRRHIEHFHASVRQYL